MKRVAVVAAGMLLVGLVASGVAAGQARTDTPTPAPLPVLGGALNSLATPGTAAADGTSPTSGTAGEPGLVPQVSTSSTSSTADGSDGTYTITFPPTLPPGHGSDGGHRYVGRYWDAAADCWRYASPHYVAPVVVATQVGSVPKGGVDTGDGSFR